MQATKYQAEKANSSHWLNIVEGLAVVSAIGGSIAVVVSQQIAIATIPLSLTATLNLANRRRQIALMQGEQRQEITSLIQQTQDVIQADLTSIHQASEAIQSQVEKLSQQGLQSSEAISTLALKTEQFESEITTLQQAQEQNQTALNTLSEQSQTSQSQFDDLSKQGIDLQSAISLLQSSTSELSRLVETQQLNSQTLASQTDNVEELVEILREIDAISQIISAQPNVAENFYQRGLVRKRLKREEDQQIALDDFSKAIQLEPTHMRAYFERGLLQSELGHKQSAVDNLRTAAKLYFEDGQLEQYERARALSQSIHDLITDSSSAPEETEQYLVENLFG
ncbi:hypothetical protein [Acaryochloris sp. CCMEE 5410]|uniref:hypothetical protein n=1 Tax=Acaryochloris sp. CCMEE 5410 TaxID=310037 RepID=UPI00024844BD|nr:hypothetical protein [Acaryochloris sp. CCMEE 5410]KAI9129414.1 hypothetical protein ON05_035455 [Acaryochloris sp. CCMEE 5410]